MKKNKTAELFLALLILIVMSAGILILQNGMEKLQSVKQESHDPSDTGLKDRHSQGMPSTVHFPLDCADCCNAGSIQQGEYQKCCCCQWCE